MKKIELKITDDMADREIKSILYHELKLSARAVTALKKGNGIMLNGEKATVRKTVTPNDTLLITFEDEGSQNIVPNNIPLDIIYEDAEILVVNKPANMPTHPSINHYENTLANAVMYHFSDTEFTFRAITRLDRDTTGLVLIAKNRYSANILSNQLQSGSLQKTYLAIACGVLPQTEGVIEAPIARENHSVIKRIISDNGQYAKSLYKVLKCENNFSLVQLAPITGRTHQLRVHLAHIGNPIYADFIYGSEIKKERTRLHCSKLCFTHPTSGEKINLFAPLPDDFFIKE